MFWFPGGAQSGVRALEHVSVSHSLQASITTLISNKHSILKKPIRSLPWPNKTTRIHYFTQLSLGQKPTRKDQVVTSETLRTYESAYASATDMEMQI